MRPDRILLQELRDGTAFFYLRNVNSGTRFDHDRPCRFCGGRVRAADVARQGSEGGRDLARDDIRGLLRMLVDVVVQTRHGGRFEVEEVYFDPKVGDAGAA
jgi:type IV secretion system protein VirB11